MNFEELIGKLYHEENNDIRRYIPDKLAKLGDWRSTEHLGKILLDETESDALRGECAESLGKQGDPRAIPYLINASNTKVDELRRTIIWSFGQIGEPEVVEILLKFKTDPNLMVRRWVAKSLGRVRGYNVHKDLIDYYLQTQTDDLHVRAEIIRAVIDQFDSCEPDNKRFWGKQAILNLKQETQVHIIQSSVIVLELVVEGIKIDLFEDIKSIYEIKKDNVVVRPYLLKILGYYNAVDLIMERQISDEVIYALTCAKFYEFHVKVITNPSQYSDQVVEAALKTIPINQIQNANQYLDHKNLGIRIAALLYNAKSGIGFENLDYELKSSHKLSYGIFEVFPFYPKETIDIIIQGMRSQDKVMRQTAFRTIIDPHFQELFGEKVHREIEYMAKHDKIWHIRRDARIYLSQL